MGRRSSFLSLPKGYKIELGKGLIKVWAYTTSEVPICRLEINAAGIGVYTGKMGKTKLFSGYWEKFIERVK